MFVAQCKNIIESEESSDEEVVSFIRRIINRISSNLDSDDEESYASEDLEEMLEELAIAEKEELTNAGDSLDNIQWDEFANKQQSFTFTGKSGLLMDLPFNINPGEVLSLFLDLKVISLLVTETEIWELLVRELLYSENTRPDNERKKTKKVSHHLEIHKNQQGKPIGRICVLCYQKKRQLLERQEARKNVKKTTTYCQNCPKLPQMCLNCFNKYLTM
ncbi:hypothetical protein K0M31_020496 [Melipona bicolor]|uniref:PiggyBac transposable element-derived protein 4 n=1 Tax=Melipona bicolor TaxID=60889 RepID=A0AA40KH22_9HYME|nr:hypothetical protein K0M31_020496 [Melipona bicolor]